MKHLKALLSGLGFVALAGLSLSGCAGVDCPLNNVVTSHWYFYDGEDAVSVLDSIYVYAKVNGRDSLVVNRLYNASSFDLQFSYYQPVDTFLLEIRHPGDDGETQIGIDWIIVDKEDLAHFNSPECGVWHEHNVTSVQSSHVLIDSIQIVRPKIDTNEEENFRIFI